MVYASPISRRTCLCVIAILLLLPNKARSFSNSPQIAASTLLGARRSYRHVRGARGYGCEMMGSAPHFRGWDTEQRAMVAGAEARLREYRRMLPDGDLATSLDGRFWDAVVVTAAN